MLKKKVKLSEASKLGKELSFAASEAYKLLRTNITLSLPQDQCQVLGITSSGPSEGKSTTAMNLAYSFALSDKRVLLVESDMRKPTISTRLDIAQKPGLSNFLLNLNALSECTRKCQLHENITILSAGDVPPNPAELLESSKIDGLIESARKHFDVVIFDLPPINVVTDALVVSTKVDGNIIVVRSDITTKKEVAEVVNALTFAKAKILGFVLTDTNLASKSYGKYKKGYGYH